jgi:hypothetical protein
VFPVLLPLWKQRNGNVMEDWWASCFLPPLLVVSLCGLLCFFEKKQRNESFVFPPQFFFLSFSFPVSVSFSSCFFVSPSVLLPCEFAFAQLL